jgi:hypothetical protein
MTDETLSALELVGSLFCVLAGVARSIWLITRHSDPAKLTMADSRQKWRWAMEIALSLATPALLVIVILGLFGNHTMSDSLTGRLTFVACDLPLPLMIFVVVTIGQRLRWERLLRLYQGTTKR